MSRKNSISKFLAVAAVVATFGTLLGWGLIATSWTQLTTTNNTRVAIEEAKSPLYTARYSLPLGSQWTYPINLTFSRGYCSSGQSGSVCSIGSPASNSSITIQKYLTFDLSIPNGTAVNVWNTGPHGNVTFDCGGSMYSWCHLEPNAPGAITGPFSYYIMIQIPGNYTLHVRSAQCMYSGNCAINTATGNVTIGVSTIQYDRPYWAWGLATEIGATIGIITTTIVAGTIAYRDQKRKEALRPRSMSNRPGQVID